jgi:hypothetical protein
MNGYNNDAAVRMTHEMVASLNSNDVESSLLKSRDKLFACKAKQPRTHRRNEIR